MTDQVFESACQWNIYGSEGRTSLGGRFLRTWRSSKNKTELILAEISIKSLWMNRTSEQISFHNLSTDFAITLSQVVISRPRIEEFTDELEQWLKSPRRVSKAFCLVPKDQNLRFRLGAPAPSKNRLEKAIFEAQYSGIAFPSGKWSFGVDQSCVRILAGELRTALEKISSAA